MIFLMGKNGGLLFPTPLTYRILINDEYFDKIREIEVNNVWRGRK